MTEFIPNNLIDNLENESGLNEPLWLSVSEIAKMCGISTKTVRRAIQAKEISYKLVKERSLIDFSSAIVFIQKDLKLRNKLNLHGLGQYVKEWHELK